MRMDTVTLEYMRMLWTFVSRVLRKGPRLFPVPDSWYMILNGQFE